MYLKETYKTLIEIGQKSISVLENLNEEKYKEVFASQLEMRKDILKFYQSRLLGTSLSEHQTWLENNRRKFSQKIKEQYKAHPRLQN